MAEEKLYDYLDPIDGECVRREVANFFAKFFPDDNEILFERAFLDVDKLFAGKYRGFRASNTRYHDFEHTCSVVLATARLIYGAMAEGHVFSYKDSLKGVLAALFHDVGLIQAEDDRNGTGAKYTVGHEERSIQFMRQNLCNTLSAQDIEDVADCIRCTTLSMSPGKVAFRTDEIRMMGHMLGTADLLAQIADRYYLEKLLLLFEEFQEARLPGYDTAYELLAKTRSFYQDVARPRLDQDFAKVHRFMRPYFKRRWEMDRDYYDEAINRNLDYLDAILNECKEDMDCFLGLLRRGGYLQTVQG